MPTPIPLSKDVADSYHPRAPIEKILGTEEGKRSTKSWIPTFEQALALSILEEFGGEDGNYLKVLRRIEEREWDRSKTPEKDREYRVWSGPKRYANLHRAILEHAISVDGKSLKVASRNEELRERAETAAKESSQKADG